MMRRQKMQLIMKILMRSMRVQRFKLLVKKEYFSTDVSLASLKPTSVFDDENYDEELEQEHEVVDNNLEVQTTSLTGDLGEILGVVSESEKYFDDDLQHASLEAEKLAVNIEEFQSSTRKYLKVRKSHWMGKALHHCLFCVLRMGW